MQLLVASGNRKKLAELTQLVAGLGVRVLSPADVGPMPEVVEDGETFEANAEKKARAFASASGHACLADDSGLAVDALGGAPGVHSARYAGRHGDDAGNNAKLLAALRDVPDAARTARFVCVLAVADPEGVVVARARGSVEGRIARAARGTDGFGYDPLFECMDADAPSSFRGRTFGELTHAEKATVSHRARALAALRTTLSELAAREPRANGTAGR